MRTETEFKEAWSNLKKENREITSLTVFSHGGIDERTSAGQLYFQSDTVNNGTLTANEIANLPKLNYGEGASIDIHACRSGLGEPSAAQSFANSQGVPAFGRRGYTYFSETQNTYSAIDKNSSQVYLDAYSRGRNSYLGSGGLMPPATFTPRRRDTNP